MRKYKTGTRWCLWRWTETDSQYITRLHLVKTPLFAICLHWLNSPDAEPFLHDHPVSFLSIILRGWYREDRNHGKGSPTLFSQKRRWFNWISASMHDRHVITMVAPKTLTLCLMGPKVREWGFWIDGGWVMWKDYYAEKRASQ